jgi:hypothetical protein
MEKHLPLFGAKMDRIYVLIRVLRKTVRTSKDVTNPVINQLLHSNLEDVLLALDNLSDDKDNMLADLLKGIKKVRSMSLSKKEKRARIVYGLQNDPEIKRRYLRGYHVLRP